MKKILFVSHHGNIVGGGEMSLLDIIHGIDRRSWEPWLLCPSGELGVRAEDLGVRLLTSPMPTLKGPGVLLYPWNIFRLYRLFQKHRFDLLHINGSRCMVYAALPAKLAGIPVLWHVRVMDRDPLLDGALYRLADRVVVISKAVGLRFEKFPNHSDKLSLVYNGIDTAAFAAADPSRIRKELGIPDENPIVGIVGRLVGFKGHRFFLEAAKEVCRRYPTARFIVAGEGPLRADLMAIAHGLGISSQTIFLGHRNDIPSVMAALDIFVLASDREHFGRVLVEAMAAGKPVVATSSGASPEIVENEKSGILIPHADPRAMAAAIIRLLDDPGLRSAMGGAGKSRARSQFSLERMLSSMNDVFRKTLESRTSSHATAY